MNFDILVNPTLLDDMSFDLTTLRLNMQGYSEWYIWAKWVRSDV